MIERHVRALRLEDPGAEEPAATRERLRELFPRAVSRRMTQLGLLLGSALEALQLGGEETLVYASTYAEGRALEDYLAGFPTPSPTLFQTSIHPSAVQQVLIARQLPLRPFFPLAGSAHLAAQALQTGLLASTPRAVICGGEERGARLLLQGVTSPATFAFALDLQTDPAGALATVRLDRAPGGEPAPLDLPVFFQALRARQSLRRRLPSGMTLSLTWR